MKILLFLNFLVEVGVGIALIANPSMFPGFEATGIDTLLATMYGGGAIALGVLGLMTMINSHVHEALIGGLLTLAIFHTCVAVVNYLHSPDLNVAILHSVFAAGFIFFYFRER